MVKRKSRVHRPGSWHRCNTPAKRTARPYIEGQQFNGREMQSRIVEATCMSSTSSSPGSGRKSSGQGCQALLVVETGCPGSAACPRAAWPTFSHSSPRLQGRPILHRSRRRGIRFPVGTRHPRRARRKSSLSETELFEFCPETGEIGPPESQFRVVDVEFVILDSPGFAKLDQRA